ncbi:MAG: MGMT family protein [Lentisphaerae bacterium]|jgi:methylated-DNA-[protein]-cysteine S-methyltransferase|nr:MGMT family protein [Lentisphaerota bacterium]MBT4814296.1 MGMT family protein [Lentisphaerota bacterium]MBT5609123.1 MGMT family protein [Lentisphaerota bacterium]MBT7058434.1 MGMT family protein [Lentisphaerota bacterium]MBT7840348.1 MGMT family protein [Lentisphaerota bacterium]
MSPRVTPFQARVYDALSRVPKGRVVTYKILGDAIGCECYQAIGQALRKNPFAPIVPCHRVIASDLSIGGFGGETSGERIASKLSLLAEEGVPFENGRLADSDQLFHELAERGVSAGPQQ